MDGTGRLILHRGLDGNGQLWDRPSLLTPVGCLDIRSLGGRWIEKDDCPYIGGWAEKGHLGLTFTSKAHWMPQHQEFRQPVDGTGLLFICWGLGWMEKVNIGNDVHF